MDNKNIRTVVSVSLNMILIIIAMVVIFIVSSKGFAFGAKIFDERGMDTTATAREIEVVIPSKVTTSQLTDILYAKGLIEDKNVFKVQVLLSDYRDKFIAGTYVLTTDMKPTEMMEKLATVAEDSKK